MPPGPATVRPRARENGAETWVRLGPGRVAAPAPGAGPQPSPGRRPYHVGREDEDALVLAAGPLRVIQEVGVVLQGIPRIGPCEQSAALTHHEPR